MMKKCEKYHCAVLGVSYKTCPVAIRDSLTRTLQNPMTMKSILALPGVSEVAVLSTCNRAEIYIATPYPEALSDTLVNWWAEYAKLDLDSIVPYCFYLIHGEAVSHLYTVVSSIDSLVLGENQILGQVREAFRVAQETKTVGVLLNHLFQSALSLGKQVREETGIGMGTVSVAHAAMELCKQEVGDISKCRVGILGLGEMGHLAATTFAAEKVEHFAFFNRSEQKAKEFSNCFGGEAFPLTQLVQELPRLDILITCAKAETFLIKASEVPNVMRTELLIVDIASPRNVDPLIASFPGISLFSIDDLNKVVEKNREMRRLAAEKARTFIEHATLDFREWFVSRDLNPLLLQMQEYHKLVGEMVLKKWETRVSLEEFNNMKRFEEELRKKILHVPFSELKHLSTAGMGLESQLILEKLYPAQDIEKHFSTGETDA
jgi:glutamyl-tRNA reductase